MRPTVTEPRRVTSIYMKGPFARLLSNLLTRAEPPCLSAYLNTHPASAQAAEHRIRLKNILKQAEETLGASPVWLEEARATLKDDEFWTYLSNSLLLFASPGSCEVLRTPLPFEEDTALCSGFCVKQLLGYSDLPERIHLLAVSSKQIRLFECTMEEINETPIPDTVQVADEFLGADDREEEFQQHSTHARSGGTIFHGQGAGRDEEDERRLRFFQHVARGLEKVLNADSKPVVLLGAQEVLTLFRTAFKSAHDCIERTGSGDRESPHDLNRMAWDALFERAKSARERTIAEFKEQRGSEACLHDPLAIAEAAGSGRIRRLFVAPDAHAWGHADVQNLQFEAFGEWRIEAVDLLDVAAVLTAKHGGEVHCVPQDRLGTPAAALLYT